MAAIQITMFNGTENPKKAKHVVSKYVDESFLFANKESETLSVAFQMMTNHFTLSQPLNLKEPTQIIRDQKHLKPYAYKRLKNIILDLDKITTKEDYLETIEYFKDKNFSCILGKSRSWNGKDCFNMKGILRVSFENKYEIIKVALTQLQIELGSKCKVDLTVGSLQSYQAPSHSKMIVHYNEKGIKFTDKDVHIENIKESMGNNYKVEVSYNNEVIDECISIFATLGYSPIRNSLSTEGAINFTHTSEVKSPGGFFWFSTQPLVMNHHNKDRTVSIFNLLKTTPVGKKWLKNKTKDEQRHQLIKENTFKYNTYYKCDERYLDFSDSRKSEIIDKFLESNKDILKIKSAMGTAKSNGIEVCIQKAHKRKERVILISNRVSVAQDFAEKYDMMWYKDKDAWKQNQSLVVQFDSLHRFDIDKFDVVILDEFISLLFHHRSNLTPNSNINIVKFKILLDTKRTLVADAFLTGYEDIFFNKRSISMIDNVYRDDIKLFEYKNKEHFASTLIEESKLLEKGTHLTASFTSNNIMKAIDLKLKRAGVKVIMLNAETPSYTKEIIFKKFKEFKHNAYEVILYSPTLTVGVSNLNNVRKHFHYDSGMSTDVVSSLQMIKRSRTAEEIHYFLEERQFYFDTDVKSINSIAETNINNFYTNKDATLLVDVDYKTGKLKLTKLGSYVNKIEAFFNITKNNHANAFKILLEHQFTGNIFNIYIEDKKFDLKETIKEIKNQEKQDQIKVLKEWENKDFSLADIDALRNKTVELSKSETVELLALEIQEKFKGNLTKDEILFLTEKQLETNFKYLGMITKLRIAKKAFNSQTYSLYLLSQTISGDVSSLQNKSYTEFLSYISLLSGTLKLKSRYSINEIAKIDSELNVKTKFLKFIKSIGYIKGEAKYFQDEDILKFSKKL